MKKNLFRGKSIKDDTIVYGSLLVLPTNNTYYIVPVNEQVNTNVRKPEELEFINVHSKSIQRNTLIEISQHEIYEGDTIEIIWDKENDIRSKGIVQYSEKVSMFIVSFGVDNSLPLSTLRYTQSYSEIKLNNKLI